MRVSGAIKSLQHGVSTYLPKLRPSKYLEAMQNMRTGDSGLLERRPPTVNNQGTGAYQIVGNSTNHYVHKYFEWENQLYSLTVDTYDAGEDNLFGRLDIRDEHGTIIATNWEQGLLRYFLNSRTTDGIVMTQQDGDVLITNKRTTVLPKPEMDFERNNAFIHIRTQPFVGEILRWKIGAYVGNITVTTGNTGTKQVAVLLAANINSVTPYPALSAGSVVRIQQFTAGVSYLDSLEISAEDEQGGQVMSAFNQDTLENIEDLPAYAKQGDRLALVSQSKNPKETIYFEATTTTASGSVAPSTTHLAVLSGYDPQSALDDGYEFSGVTGDGWNGTTLVGGTITSGGSPPPGISTCTDAYIKSNLSETFSTLVLRFSDQTTELDVVHINVATGLWVNEVKMTKIGGGHFEGLLPNGVTGASGGFLISAEPKNESLLGMEKVLWKESSAQNEYTLFDELTMPWKISRSAGGVVQITTIDWQERDAGNDLSNPFPAFTNNKINDMKRFQNRWLVATAESIQTSATEANDDDKFLWFRDTVSQLLPTHPVHIKSTSNKSDTIHHIVEHNRDLIIFDKDSQFKITGDIALTPTTAGMTLATDYENNTGVRPVSLGKNIFFAFEDGVVNGIRQYQQASNIAKQDVALDTTEHARGYIDEEIIDIQGSASEGTLVLHTLETLFVCNYNSDLTTNEDKRFSWSKWDDLLAADENPIIEAVYLYKGKVHLTISSDLQGVPFLRLLNHATIDLTTQSTPWLHMDSQGEHTVAVAGILETDPAQQNTPSLILARTDTGHYGELVAWTVNVASDIDAPIFDIDPSIPVGTTIMAGYSYSSNVTPSPPYVRDQSGLINNYTHFSILKWLIHMELSGGITATIESAYYADQDVSWSGLAANDIFTLADQVAASTSVFHVGFKHPADKALLNIHTDSHLPMTISQIEWLGNYISRGRRF